MKTIILTVRTHKTCRRRSECMTDARRMNKFAPQKVAVWTTIWAAATSGGKPADWLFQALFPGVSLISTYVSPYVSGQGGHAAHSWPREHREANPGCGKDPDSAGKWNAEEPTRLNPKGKWIIRCRQLMKKEIQAVARLSKSKGDQMIPERGISHGLRWKWRKTGKLLEWLAKELLQLWSLGCYQWEDLILNNAHFLYPTEWCPLPLDAPGTPVQFILIYRTKPQYPGNPQEDSMPESPVPKLAALGEGWRMM